MEQCLEGDAERLGETADGGQAGVAPATTNAALAEYGAYLEPVGGEAFDRAAQRGHALTIQDAAGLVVAADS